jgi:hypothetical protein
MDICQCIRPFLGKGPEQKKQNAAGKKNTDPTHCGKVIKGLSQITQGPELLALVGRLAAILIGYAFPRIT